MGSQETLTSHPGTLRGFMSFSGTYSVSSECCGTRKCLQFTRIHRGKE